MTDAVLGALYVRKRLYGSAIMPLHDSVFPELGLVSVYPRFLWSWLKSTLPSSVVARVSAHFFSRVSLSAYCAARAIAVSPYRCSLLVSIAVARAAGA